MSYIPESKIQWVNDLRDEMREDPFLHNNRRGAIAGGAVGGAASVIGVMAAGVATGAAAAAGLGVEATAAAGTATFGAALKKKAIGDALFEAVHVVGTLGTAAGAYTGASVQRALRWFTE